MGKNYENKKKSNYKGNKESQSARDGKYNSGARNEGKKFRNEDGKSGTVCGRHNSVGDTSYNHPSWYEPFSGSTDLVAKVSFGTPLGYTWDFNNYHYSGARLEGSRTAFPGILRVNYVPVCGISAPGDVNSPINYLSHAYYTTVRYAQRGSGTYDDSDLMLGTLGISSLYEYWAWMRRIYGVLNLYSVGNKYMAEALINSMDVDFNDLHDHIYDFQGYLNNFALRLGQFCLPADFHFVDRRVRMNSNIYTDDNVLKAQMYYFNPVGFYFYDELADERYASLTLKPVYRTGATIKFDDIIRFGNDLYYSVRSSQTLMNMAGDVKNAYGDAKLKSITATSEAYVAPFLYDEEMCMELQNMTLVGDVNMSSAVIKADASTNLIECRPYVDNFSVNMPSIKSWFINFRKDEPSSYNVMRATRLMTFISNEPDTEGTIVPYLLTAGSEFCTTAVVYKYQMDADGYVTLAGNDIVRTVMSDADPDTLPVICVLSKFDYHPYVYTFNGIDEADADITFVDLFGDVANITTIDLDTIEKINLYAIMGLFKNDMMDTFFVK